MNVHDPLIAPLPRPTGDAGNPSWTAPTTVVNPDTVSEAPSDAVAARLAALSARRAPTPTDNGPETNQRRAVAPTKRHHPAKRARIAALGLSLASTGGLATLFGLAGAQTGNQIQAASIVAPVVASPSTTLTTTPTTSGTTAPTAVVPATPATSTSTVPQSAPPEAASTTVIDGGVFHNKWGDVQVRATIGSDGSLIDVTALQVPYRDGKSVRINDRAVPRLVAEALTTQIAQVDTVSGATYTSNDYRRSLQSAIDAARSAGIVVNTA